MKQMCEWLGPERLSKLPLDLVPCFIRGYAYRMDRAEATCAFLDRCIGWRAEQGADSICSQNLPKRERFEELMPEGPIGFDGEGHPVVLQRAGAFDVPAILREFDEASHLRQQMFSREALRLYSTANSLQRGKRIYKSVCVVDMKGLGPSFRQLMDRLKASNAVFSWHYPESVHRFYIINTPLFFRALWAIVKGWLHPITASKIDILGYNYVEVFQQEIGSQWPVARRFWWDMLAEFD